MNKIIIEKEINLIEELIEIEKEVWTLNWGSQFGKLNNVDKKLSDLIELIENSKSIKIK